MKTLLVLTGMLFLLTMSDFTFASEGHDHGSGNEPAMNKSTEEEVGNTLCPVSGDELGGKMGEPYEYAYEGKVYNLCCKMCLKDFKKDPEKYSRIAEENAQKNS